MRRLATMTIVFAMTLSAATGLALHRFGTPALEVMRGPRRPLAAFEAVMRHADFLRAGSWTPRPLVLWLGDSTIDPFVQNSFPEMIERRNRGRYTQQGVALFGLDLFHYYPVLGDVLATKPELVVLIANPRLFEAGRDPQRFQLLSALIPFDELPRAAFLPLAVRDLTVPRLLMNRALRSAPVREAFGRVEGLRVLFREGDFWEPLGKPTRWGRSFAEAHAQRLYVRPIGRRAPVVRMLEASVDLAHRHGAKVMVIVSPIPWERLTEAGLYDPVAYGREIAILREATEGAGGELLDLHRSLAKDEFRDKFGHYTEAGARHLSRIVEPHVLRAIGLEPRGRRHRSNTRPAPSPQRRGESSSR